MKLELLHAGMLGPSTSEILGNQAVMLEGLLQEQASNASKRPSAAVTYLRERQAPAQDAFLAFHERRAALHQHSTG